MITTRARLGSAGGAAAPPRPSVIPGRLVQQGAEPGGREALGRALEALHRPGPEIEVERAGRALNRPPQRPAVLPGQAEQPRPGDLVPQRPAVVPSDELGQPVVGQAALGGDVAELEARVVVARVLVVDQPDAGAVVDEVGGQQVVVARDRALVPDGQRPLDGLELRHQLVVAIRYREPAVAYDAGVPALDV